jgi:glutaredoxin 2
MKEQGQFLADSFDIFHFLGELWLSILNTTLITIKDLF